MPAASRLPVDSAHARDRVLTAATRLFAQHGYQAIGLRDLAGHLGVRAGSLYHHIESKQALLFELIESSLTDLLYETRQRLKGLHTPEDRLEGFVLAFITYRQSRPDQLTLLTREAINLDPDQWAQVERLKERYANLLVDIVAEECRLSGPTSLAHAIAHAVLSLLSGQSHWNASVDVREQVIGFVQGIVGTGKMRSC
ncbi:TetR/AcrR family transcriptional regulator [Pseudomonas sp. S75]|uniref:TetR/AcrR family transcriptional regulator n=1 Tax=unclassified Pseudomonas TaxID=196821 RepID=UPI001908DCFF|nr:MULTISPECIES: TetR/AcrR family transcriptional regulator [unclassified Pseudomonas]MBJ9976331.1 TetR/AcrR family transcriptional regulator [Pseudomonas sp. S30]MBK0154557.1 TetR/AcrR family transcriptional regulator [Pseudomonas sp. S75]